MRWAVLCVNAVHLSVAVGDWAYRHITERFKIPCSKQVS